MNVLLKNESETKLNHYEKSKMAKDLKPYLLSLA